MCGIAGISTTRPNESLRPAADRMASSMKHRGPDSQAIQEFPSCLLVNARLSIIDLSDRSRMPMSSQDGQIWITYNGETYNAAELRADLEQRGHTFRTTSDTEVVLHLYMEHGEHFVEKLRGMFAFAIWDARESKLVLGRDRLGIKPLYLFESSGKLVFASEIKTLLASGLVPRKLDPAGLRAFLQLGHIPPPWSAIRGVTPLTPGHIGVWKDGKWRTEEYWSLKPHSSSIATEHLADDLSKVLLDAMRNHLVSDVPVLIFLSGGTDSACLGALARAAGAQNVSAMTVGFDEADFDETELTRRTAQALDIPLEVVKLEARRVEADLDHAVWALDEPSVDGLNSYWISKLGAEAGFKVAISGQGGDELFGGYESLPWFERFNTVAQWAKPFPANPFGRLLDRDSFPFRWRKLSYLVGADDPFVAAQLAVKVLFLDRDVDELMSSYSFARNGHPAEAREHLTYWSKQVEKEDLRERLAFMDIHTHLEPRLLRDLDAMSMAHSLEVRPVFIDHRLVEFLLPVPSSIRIQQKRLLLEAAKAFLSPVLLADLASRQKRTFTFPFQRWLSRDLRHVLKEAFGQERLRQAGILEPAAVNRLWERYERSEGAVGWSRIWNLFVLQRWCELMQVSP